jgi:hypothetical protein
MTSGPREVVVGAALRPEAVARPEVSGGLVRVGNEHHDVVDLHAGRSYTFTWRTEAQRRDSVVRQPSGMYLEARRP